MEMGDVIMGVKNLKFAIRTLQLNLYPVSVKWRATGTGHVA